MPTVDTLVAQHLLKTVAAARLMGADCIISGIRPQIAQTIVHLGVDLGDVVTPRPRSPTRSPSRCALRGHRPTLDASARRAPAESERAPMERIPILKMGEFLLVTIQVDMHDRLAMTLQDDLTERIVRARARRADRHLGARDRRLVHRPHARQHRGDVAVLDAETVVVGMRPAVAITLVELGLSLPGVRTALNVERGMDCCAASGAGGRRHDVLR